MWKDQSKLVSLAYVFPNCICSLSVGFSWGNNFWRSLALTFIFNLLIVDGGILLYAEETIIMFFEMNLKQQANTCAGCEPAKPDGVAVHGKRGEVLVSFPILAVSLSRELITKGGGKVFCEKTLFEFCDRRCRRLHASGHTLDLQTPSSGIGY